MVAARILAGSYEWRSMDERAGFRWKEQRGRNGGIVGIPWKMRIVEFVRQQQAVLCLLVFLYNAENPWNPQRDWNTFFLKVRKIRLFSYKVFHFTFVPNRRTVAIVHNFIDYFRWIESLFVIGCVFRIVEEERSVIGILDEIRVKWMLDGDTRVTRWESSWKWRGSLVEFRMQ